MLGLYISIAYDALQRQFDIPAVLSPPKVKKTRKGIVSRLSGVKIPTRAIRDQKIKKVLQVSLVLSS